MQSASHEGVASAGSSRAAALPLMLAFLSGAPALVYEVVWTREVALLVSSQTEAIAGVLVTFFGGLALGAAVLGRRMDVARSPLRVYGVLEVLAGLGAIAALLALRAAGPTMLVHLGERMRLAVACGGLLPVTFLLGGTLPALLRAVTGAHPEAPRWGGWIVGLNTAGAVAGVAAAALLIPVLGLRLSVIAAGAVSVLVGAVAIRAGRAAGPIAPGAPEAPGPDAPWSALAVAAGAGVATIGYEVLAARAAAQLLGSSLYAWAAVLGLFLIGLAAGNVVFASVAGRASSPRTALGMVEVGAALAIAAAVLWTVPSATMLATGLTGRSMLLVVAAVVPAAMLMGGAFPFFVRLGVRRSRTLAGSFAAVSAANTAGGILGAVSAPIALPWLGLEGALLACAGVNAALGAALLGAGGTGVGRLARPAAVMIGAAVVVVTIRGQPAPLEGRILCVAHGREATAVVVRHGRRRDLIVDGELEASTGSDARVTEELLGTVPLLLHPQPRTLLEIGLGSGITLGAASRFPLETLTCVEIAASVIETAPCFEPDNRGVASGADERIEIVHGDGRAWLLRTPGAFDVIIANTVHPWSVGATGLYSREYFTRVRTALRDGGLTAQWIPAQRIGADSLAAILRTFFTVFEAGEVWWAAENLIVVGRRAPVPATRADDLVAAGYPRAARVLAALGVSGPEDLCRRRLATAGDVREAVGAGEVIVDDLPLLEIRALRGRSDEGSGGELALVARITSFGARDRPDAAPTLAYFRARALRAAGSVAEADGLEAEAAAGGCPLARGDRARRAAGEAVAAMKRGRRPEAARLFGAALADDPAHAQARFGLAVLAAQAGDTPAARRELDRLLAVHPDHAEGWNLLGVLAQRDGRPREAIDAFARAVAADPFYPEALANRGLLALESGDRGTAQEMLERLERLEPRGEAAAALGAAIR